MSLINDALKRAAEAEKRQTGARRPRRRAPKGAEALGPMVHAKPVKSRRDMLFISPAFGLIMLIILMGGLSTFLLHNWWTKHRAFKPVIPEGMDPLEYMIAEDPRLNKTKKKEGPIVVGANGVVGLATVTNTVPTNQPTATTNVSMAPPPAVQIAQDSVTNRASIPPPAPDTATNALPNGVLMATAPSSIPSLPGPTVPVTKPPIPETTEPKTISASVPTVSGPTPTKTGPVIVRPRGPEGNKTQEQVDADRASRERDRKMASNHEPIVVGPARGTPEKPKIEFPEIKVIGIMHKQESASAYVNGKIITLGDRIQGAELVEIRGEYLTFSFKGSRQNFYISR